MTKRLTALICCIGLVATFGVGCNSGTAAQSSGSPPTEASKEATKESVKEAAGGAEYLTADSPFKDYVISNYTDYADITGEFIFARLERYQLTYGFESTKGYEETIDFFKTKTPELVNGEDKDWTTYRWHALSTDKGGAGEQIYVYQSKEDPNHVWVHAMLSIQTSLNLVEEQKLEMPFFPAGYQEELLAIHNLKEAAVYADVHPDTPGNQTGSKYDYGNFGKNISTMVVDLEFLESKGWERETTKGDSLVKTIDGDTYRAELTKGQIAFMLVE